MFSFPFLFLPFLCLPLKFDFEIKKKKQKIGTKIVSSTLTPTKSNQNPTTDTSLASTVNQQQLLIRKRSGSSLSSDADSINNCKKRNISHRIIRLKQIRDKHADHVAEIYFLQTGGNMMDYPTWRKKPSTSDFLNFMKQYRLESNANESSTNVTTAVSTVTATPSFQQVTYIHYVIFIFISIVFFRSLSKPYFFHFFV